MDRTEPILSEPPPAAIPFGVVQELAVAPDGSLNLAIPVPCNVRAVYLGLRPPPDTLSAETAGAPMKLLQDTLTPSFRGIAIPIVESPIDLQIAMMAPGAPAIQVLAILEMTEDTATTPEHAVGFPGEALLGALARSGDPSFPAVFTNERTSAFQLPRVWAGRPALPDCDDVGTIEAARACARSEVNLLWRCLAHRRLITSAPRKALALFLDDALAQPALEQAATGACDSVVRMRPSQRAVDQADRILQAVSETQETHPSGPGVLTPDKPASEPAQEEPPTEAPAGADDRTAHEEHRTALAIFGEALEKTGAGGRLLEALRESGGDDSLEIQLSLLAQGLTQIVDGRTGLLNHIEDVALLEAAHELRRLPGWARSDPLAPSMGLIDGWSARVLQRAGQGRIAEGFVERVRAAAKPEGPGVRGWLERHYPLLAAEGKRVLALAGARADGPQP